MIDLISRAAAIDAIVSVTAFPDAEYIKNLCQNPANSEDWLGGVCDAINSVEEVNAVDAAPVVFCKDCKHYNTTGCATGFGWCEDTVVSTGVWDNFYCADGERRESE